MSSEIPSGGEGPEGRVELTQRCAVGLEDVALPSACAPRVPQAAASQAGQICPHARACSPRLGMFSRCWLEGMTAPNKCCN